MNRLGGKSNGPTADADVNTKPVVGEAPRATPQPVVWISGFSASGKTTVGRQVESLLNAKGITTVMLDGDDLRSILAQKWGYSRNERIDLARVYFRLCSHLANQGITVVICAVAMYDEVRHWLREHVLGAIEIFLDVPESERRKRDQRTKGIYGELGTQSDLYDEPRAPDLVVANYGAIAPETAARNIVDYVTKANLHRSVDHGRTSHWRKFYASASVPSQPSSYAEEVATILGHSSAHLLEVGCGNGRDASFFAAQGMRVTAIDISSEAINAARQLHDSRQLTFLEGQIARLPVDLGPFDAIYSRFCLHAMTPSEEDEFLRLSAMRVRPGGNLFIECRSINDSLARQGEIISATERIHGHYRRFIVANELLAKLDSTGFQINDFHESDGLSPLGDDDPVLIRVHASARR